uniref:RNA helicase n=1 Tax=Saccoglossus kowalevskii TaxID=10224 RepID=A0ABM0M278_SACKO|nr:PREDICTED: putative ATP-dependent RNA helicase TDRD12-like [Saccoglossus kowalevskii]
MQQLSDITILKVVNAGQFLGKENPSIGMSSEARRFMELCNEIDDFCNSAQVVTVYVRFPEAGQMCLAMGPDKRWYRVRVLSVMQTTLGPQVKCYLVDFAETLLVPHSKLRKAPLKFLKCPHQAKKYQLFGVQPVTLLTSMEDFSTTMQPVHKWDTAANEYVSALIKMETFDVMVEICHIDKDKEHHVILYLNTAKGLINLNQLLVNEDYAIAIDDIKGSLDGKCLPTASTPDGRTRTVLGSEYTSQSTTPDTSCSVSPIQSLTSVEKAGNKAFALMHSQKMYEGDSKVQKPGFRDSYTSPLEVDVTHEIKGDGRESKECATASSLDVEHESTSSLIGSSYTDAFKQRQKLEKASSDNVIMLTRDMEQDALVQRFIAGYSSVRQAEDSLLKKTHDSSTSLNKGTSYRLSTLKSMLQMVETQPSEPDSLRTPGFVESPNKPSAEASKSKGMRDERLYFVDERKMPVESIKSWQMKSLSSEYERFREPGDHLPPSIKRTSRSLMDQLTHHRGREEGLQTSPEFGQFRQPVEDENIKYEGTPEDPNTSQGLVVKKISPGTFFTRQAVEDLKHLSGYQDRKEEFGINAASVLKMNESPEAVFSKQVTKDQALLPDSKEKEANLRLSPSLGVTKNVSPETYFFKGRGKALGISPSIVKKNTSPEIIFSKGRGLKALGTSPSVVKKDTTPEKIFSKGRGIAIGASLSSVVNKNASPETVFSKGRGLKALATSPSSIVKKNTRPETVFSRQAPEDQQLLLGNKGKELTLTSPLLVLNKGRGLISRLPRCAEKKQMTTSDTVKSPTVSSKNWALDGSFNEEDVSSTDISTLIGQRIMKQLTGATDDRPIQNESSSLAGHVSVYGDLKPKPIIDINRTPFPDLLKQPLEDQGFPGPTLVQAYAWPSILRGRDFVGISARSTGKTLAYLLPALTQLLQASTYSKLPSGEGPLVLILSPSWKRAQFIYDNCKIFLQESESTRTLLLFGAGSEDTQIFSLLSGCEVLIATPSCLARLLEKSYTLLNRLCHLVFDDADLLMEDFPSQINDIMKSYAVCLSNHRGRCSPRQVIIMSTVWTAGIESLMKAYQVDPLIVLTSKVEAAVYSKVIQTVHVCLSSQRFALLLDELDSVLSRSKKTILFANTKSDAVCLQQLFSSYSHFSLLAHSDLMDHQMEMIRHEWKSNHRDDSNPILVMTDDVILDLGITDANCIIHFDFPPNKYKFGNRLGCMADNYGECHRKNAELDNPCMSLLFVTETCDRHIPSLVYLLNRIGDKQCIPKQLEDVLHQAIEMREQEKKDQDICAQLKAYGFCRDGVLCNSRHKVFADLEAPKLPVKGYVKVLITHVVDATHFYARVLEYRETENSPSEDSIASQYVQLLIKLTLWYGTSSRKIVVSTVFVNSMYAIEDKRKHTFQRVIVTAVKNEDNCDDVEVGIVLKNDLLFSWHMSTD